MFVSTKKRFQDLQAYSLTTEGFTRARYIACFPVAFHLEHQRLAFCTHLWYLTL